MRPDQIERLNALSEAIADELIVEADPQYWDGYGKLPTELDDKERGNRVWQKKNAKGTGDVLRLVLDVGRAAQERASSDPGTQAQRDEEEDRQLQEIERRTAKVVALAHERRAKAANAR